ncbi:PadR family transcriptional regulator [Mobilicoccus sp.]|uniref:PadR family transcriptional regulator n=2 Tax=Mobilicoccus sp. TaxID=2034349 RepID=UPI0028A1F382|nr:PadR family transcriptional regulator [Mobilicoccus sp.]
MSVFGHGQMRLYLLALLREGPRHGYDVIRDLEQRFSGLYSPSAGTVYPRLAKLEEEGLVERTDEGRKALYRLTDAGRAEVEARREEVEALEASLDASASRLAEEMRARVRASAAELRSEMDEAAGAARSASGRGGRAGQSGQAWSGAGWWQSAMDGGLGSSGRPGSPAPGLEALFGSLGRGPDVEAVTRALRSWGFTRFGETPEDAPGRAPRSSEPDVADRASATCSTSTTKTGAGPDVRQETPPGAPGTGGPHVEILSEDVEIAGEDVDILDEDADVVGEVVDGVDPQPGSDTRGGRGHDTGFPSAEQAKEVVAILKDAGERIREVLERPRP